MYSKFCMNLKIYFKCFIHRDAVRCEVRKGLKYSQQWKEGREGFEVKTQVYKEIIGLKIFFIVPLDGNFSLAHSFHVATIKTCHKKKPKLQQTDQISPSSSMIEYMQIDKVDFLWDKYIFINISVARGVNSFYQSSSPQPGLTEDGSCLLGCS